MEAERPPPDGSQSKTESAGASGVRPDSCAFSPDLFLPFSVLQLLFVLFPSWVFFEDRLKKKKKKKNNPGTFPFILLINQSKYRFWGAASRSQERLPFLLARPVFSKS